jgi:hypothetical protein
VQIKFNVSNTGVKFVAGALAKNRVLKLLNLSENTFGEEGLNVLLKSLSENKVIKHVLMDEIPFTPAGAYCFFFAAQSSIDESVERWRCACGSVCVCVCVCVCFHRVEFVLGLCEQVQHLASVALRH